MKFSYFIKTTPFFSTLLLIIFLCVSNQKEYTKIRILIWNTPSLTLGNYLAISTGTGFVLSYFITKKLGKIVQTSQKQSLGYKENDKLDEVPEYKESVMNNNSQYNNTLIERNLKDPSPTINASFRIIGRKESRSFNCKISNNDDIQYEDSFDFEDDQNEQLIENETFNESSSITSDWDDGTYLKW
jgi:hypothetical protein